MFRRRVAAVLLTVVIGTGVAACDGKADSGAGRSKEDPTLGDPDGGGTSDKGSAGTTGATPGSGGGTNGSGTGAGR